MQGTASVNRRIVLAARPQGKPKLTDFRLETAAVPVPEEGQMLLRTTFLSLDPYMRGRMNDGPSYAAPVALGDVMVGSTICRVEQSQNAAFHAGDLVLAEAGWQDYSLSSGNNVTTLDPSLSRPSYALGALGMPGFTAYMGLLEIGQPKAGETVVVAAATGAVGSAVGQIATIKGCRAVGLAGGAEKCRYAVEDLGFAACIDHGDPEMSRKLQAACPDGIDIYFENVGGAVLDAVIPLLNVHARIPLCGLIAQYNAGGAPQGPDRLPKLMGTLLARRIKMQGFIIFSDFGDRFGEFYAEMNEWMQKGLITCRETVIEGLEEAPQALIGLLEGRNFGKLVIRVAP